MVPPYLPGSGHFWKFEGRNGKSSEFSCPPPLCPRASARASGSGFIALEQSPMLKPGLPLLAGCLVHQGVTHRGFGALWWVSGRDSGLMFFSVPSGDVRWVATSYSSGLVSLLVTFSRGILPLASGTKLGLTQPRLQPEKTPGRVWRLPTSGLSALISKMEIYP